MIGVPVRILTTGSWVFWGQPKGCRIRNQTKHLYVSPKWCRCHVSHILKWPCLNAWIHPSSKPEDSCHLEAHLSKGTWILPELEIPDLQNAYNWMEDVCCWGPNFWRTGHRHPWRSILGTDAQDEIDGRIYHGYNIRQRTNLVEEEFRFFFTHDTCQSLANLKFTTRVTLCNVFCRSDCRIFWEMHKNLRWNSPCWP